MSETREPQYVVLNESEDFKLTAHIDSDGQQSIIVEGYLERTRADGTYRTPLTPELFYGADGTQLHSWSQYLTAGDHVVLRRDSGNPFVPDSDLHWFKVSGTTTQPLLDTVLETYKGWEIVEHTGAETYYYARQGSTISPHFLVPGDPVASIAQVKAWIDQQGGGIPWIPIVVGGVMAVVVIYFITRHR